MTRKAFLVRIKSSEVTSITSATSNSRIRLLRLLRLYQKIPLITWVLGFETIGAASASNSQLHGETFHVIFDGEEAINKSLHVLTCLCRLRAVIHIKPMILYVQTIMIGDGNNFFKPDVVVAIFLPQRLHKFAGLFGL